jgi:hypothetical protein
VAGSLLQALGLPLEGVPQMNRTLHSHPRSQSAFPSFYARVPFVHRVSGASEPKENRPRCGVVGPRLSGSRAPGDTAASRERGPSASSRLGSADGPAGRKAGPGRAGDVCALASVAPAPVPRARSRAPCGLASRAPPRPRRALPWMGPERGGHAITGTARSRLRLPISCKGARVPAGRTWTCSSVVRSA